MASLRVLPALNPGKDGQSCLGLLLLPPSVDQLAFQRCKEALGHCAVVRIAHRTPAGAHAHLSTAPAEPHAGVLAAFGWSGQSPIQAYG